MTPHSFDNLGGKERPIDTRDIPLGAVQPPSSHPISYHQDITWGQPVLYQGKQPACGAHAGAAMKMTLDDFESPNRYYTPRFNWVDIKSFDGFAIDDGTDMRSIFKSLQNTGALDFDVMGNDVTLDEQSYATFSFTQEMKDAANSRVIGTYAFLNDMSFEGIKNAIYQNKGILLLIQVGSEFWTAPNGVTSWAEKDVLPLRAPKKVVSGHFVFAHSYDEKYIYFLNSWSDTWGRKGHGYFGADYLPYVIEAGTAVDVPDSVIPTLKQEKTLAQEVIVLLEKLVSRRKNGG